MQKTEIPAAEHILVCLSSSPSNERIVRTAGRMASVFGGSFTALYVQTPENTAMREDDQLRLQENTRLAQQLGAEIVTMRGEDVPTQIAEYARLSGVTRIVIGRSGAQRRSFWSSPTLTERLIELAPGLDIHIIPDVDVYKNYHQKKPTLMRPAMPTIRELLLTLGILTAATTIGWLFLRLGFTDANIITLYLLGVLFTSVLTSGYTCGILASILSVILFNYFLTEPHLSLLAYGSGYPVTFVIMLGASIGGNGQFGPVLAAQAFGRKDFSVSFSCMNMISGIVRSCSYAVLAVLHSMSNGYSAPYTVFGIIAVVGGCMIFAMKEKKKEDVDEDTVAAY